MRKFGNKDIISEIKDKRKKQQFRVRPLKPFKIQVDDGITDEKQEAELDMNYLAIFDQMLNQSTNEDNEAKNRDQAVKTKDGVIHWVDKRGAPQASLLGSRVHTSKRSLKSLRDEQSRSGTMLASIVSS